MPPNEWNILDFEKPIAELDQQITEIKLLTPMGEPSGMAGIVAFRHPRAQALHARMRAANVHIMHHAGRLRVAIHGYNTPADIEAFLCALHEGLKDV
jgi:selenocysteine lyase/cysteine desulfurase